MVLDAIHTAQLREHGGAGGIRDEGLLESALTRPRNKFAYGETELIVLAAAYAFAIVKGHGYVDGNKRTGFAAAAVCLAINGKELQATEPAVVDAVTRLASGKMAEAAFAQWLREHVTSS